MQREKFIDVAKGIGILLVVYGHVLKTGDMSGMDAVVNCIYSFHMPLFFFITGYCLGIKKTPEGVGISFLSELKKISLRLIVPYLVWSTVYMYIAGNITSTERIKAVLTTRGIAPLWFLATLALCEVAFVLVQFATQKLGRKGRAGVLISISMLSIAVAFVMNMIQSQYDLSVDNPGVAAYYLFVAVGRFFLSFPVLIFGYLFAKAEVMGRVGKAASGITGTLMIALLAVLVTLSGAKTNVHTFDINNYWVFICASLLGSVGVLLISYSIAKYVRVLEFLGVNSLGIMVLHYLPFRAIAYSKELSRLISANVILVSFIAATVTLLISAAGIWLIKKKFFLYK